MVTWPLKSRDWLRRGDCSLLPLFFSLLPGWTQWCSSSVWRMRSVSRRSITISCVCPATGTQRRCPWCWWGHRVGHIAFFNCTLDNIAVSAEHTPPLLFILLLMNTVVSLPLSLCQQPVYHSTDPTVFCYNRCVDLFSLVLLPGFSI